MSSKIVAQFNYIFHSTMGRKSKMQVTVIGSGNIGLSTAGHLTLIGHKVRLFEFPDFEDSLAEVAKKGFIDVKSNEACNLPSGRAYLDYAGTDISHALKETSLVISTVPAYGEKRTAEVCAPWLKSGQNVYLFSGYMYGSIEFLLTLRRCGNSKDIAVAEMNNSIYAGKKSDGNKVSIGCYKHGLGMASFPGSKGSEMLEKISEIYPEIELQKNLFELGVSNPSVGIHAGVMVFNPRYVEQAAEVMLYHEGKYLSAFGDAAARVYDDMDQERLALQRTSIIDSLKPCSQIFLDWYGYQGAKGNTIMEIMHSNVGLSQALLPKTFNHRYLTEDVCMGLIPLIELLERCDLPKNICSSILFLCSSLSGIDLQSSARTLKSLGLDTLSNDALKEYVYKGI